MTNFEKYKEEIMDILGDGSDVGIEDNKLKSCSYISCNRCGFHATQENKWCQYNFFKWGMQEYVEPKRLTKEEHYFCVVVKSGYIARDKEGLYYFNTDVEWIEHFGWDFIDDGEFINIDECIPHLKFDAIGMNEKFKIEELLQMEVSDDE